MFLQEKEIEEKKIAANRGLGVDGHASFHGKTANNSGFRNSKGSKVQILLNFQE